MTIEPMTFDEVKEVFRDALDKANTPTEFIHNILTMSSELGYNAGLNDAWDCAKKITNKYTIKQLKDILLINNIPLTNSEYEYSCRLIAQYSASEAISAIKEYEEKKKMRPNCSYLNDICPYDIKCDDCEVFCSIKRGRNKVHELRESYR